MRHDEKMTVYVTAEELLDLEHARLLLRRDHDLAVDLEAVCARHDRNMIELVPALQQLESFCADGLLQVRGGRLNVIGAGRLVVRSMCAGPQLGCFASDAPSYPMPCDSMFASSIT